MMTSQELVRIVPGYISAVLKLMFSLLQTHSLSFLARSFLQVLELMTSHQQVHEGNLSKCETEKITKSLLQVLDNHLGDEIIIESILHLLIHFDFERLEATCRQVICPHGD